MTGKGPVQGSVDPTIKAVEDHPDPPDFDWASGDCICETCGKEYWRHPKAPEYTDWDGRPYLVRVCNGRLFKL